MRQAIIWSNVDILVWCKYIHLWWIFQEILQLSSTKMIWNISKILFISPKGQWVKVHLHYFRDFSSSIWVWARMQSKQVNWCFMFTMIRVSVRDFCLGRPCPSSALYVAISLDADVRVHLRLCNTHAQRHLFTWSLLQATKMAMASDPNPGCSVNKTLSGAQTRMLGQGKCKCALKI